MATLPVPSNVVVNIYRGSNPSSPVPGGLPAASGVPGYLSPDLESSRAVSAKYLNWTHVLLLPAGTDVRNAYNSQLDPARSNNSADTVVVKDSANGSRMPYYVVFVEILNRGTPRAQVRVYLDRFQPSAWPCDGG